MIAVIRRRAGRWALKGAAAISLAYILLPLIFVVWLAFFRQEIPSFPPEGYSLKWFVAVLNNQPQGGFLMRRPTVENVRVASGKYWGNDGFGFFFQRNWNSQSANTRPRTGQYYQPMQQRWW